jgi:hypothetical protein
VQRTSGLAGSLRTALPGQAPPPAQQTAAQSGEPTDVTFDENGNPIAAKGQNRRFFLDWLLY